jgi:predicted amidohydrolase YtcJ
MQDGVAENFTAAMTFPYLDRCGAPTTNAGHSFVEGQALRTFVARLDAAGFQVHIHAIGDRGAREALDAFDGTDRANRHHIAHLQVVHPDDLSRFAAMGVSANLQMLWACHDDQMVELTMPFLGPQRATWQYPFGSLYRAGTRLAAGSDWPVSTPDPLAAIHVAVTRTQHDEPGRAGTDAFLPQQALPLEVAFAAYTSGSAWINHRDDAGTLRVGACADLVLLDRDPFAGPTDEIGAAAVRSTWINGSMVYPG